MLLTIDVGNTQTVLGVFAPEPRDGFVRDHAAGEGGGEGGVLALREPGEMPGLLHHWRVATARERTGDEWALLISSLLRARGLHLWGLEATPEGAAITGVALSSSVPSVTAALRVIFTERLRVPVVIVEPGIKTGMPILYENPREVGADRIVNAVGALDLYAAPIIVVDLGTATTFDAISGGGEYLGGAIVPGIEISMDALFLRAAALRRVELLAPRTAIGRTTVDAMRSGAIFGYAGLVDGLVARFVEELGAATVVVTGGLGGLIAPHARSVHHYEPWLTLHGLRLLFWRNCDESGVQG